MAYHQYWVIASCLYTKQLNLLDVLYLMLCYRFNQHFKSHSRIHKFPYKMFIHISESISDAAVLMLAQISRGMTSKKRVLNLRSTSAIPRPLSSHCNILCQNIIFDSEYLCLNLSTFICKHICVCWLQCPPYPNGLNTL